LGCAHYQPAPLDAVPFLEVESASTDAFLIVTSILAFCLGAALIARIPDEAGARP
jgi:hypothetical protein